MTALRDVHGIGPSLESQLHEAGYTTVAGLATADPNKLVAVRGIGSVSARRIIAAAADLTLGTDRKPSVPKRTPAAEKETSGAKKTKNKTKAGKKTKKKSKKTKNKTKAAKKTKKKSKKTKSKTKRTPRRPRPSPRLVGQHHCPLTKVTVRSIRCDCRVLRLPAWAR